MPFCPVCRSEYIEGKTRCPDCDVSLVDELLEEPAEGTPPVPDPEEMAEISRRQAAAAHMNTHTSARHRHSELKSSAWTFLILGAAGTLLLTLSLLDVIRLPLHIFAQLVLLGMFLCFLAVSYCSFRSAARVFGEIAKEEELEERIREWARTNLDAEALGAKLEEDAPEEMKYFLISEMLRERLMAQFPELDDAYAEALTERYYNELFS